MRQSATQIVLTGAGGHVGSATALLLAAESAAQGRPWRLRLVETAEGMAGAKALQAELEDGCWASLESVEVALESAEAFSGANGCLLVGAHPRKPGQTRRELLEQNGQIMARQGRWIGQQAAADCRTLVVGNPCNTLCLVAWSHSGRSPTHFLAMTALDSQRARRHLAQKAQVNVAEISHCAVWGNHSESCVPGWKEVLIGGRPATERVERSWLLEQWPRWVRERGTEVLKLTGHSAALSAATAAVKTWLAPWQAGEDWLSAGFWSPGGRWPQDLFIGAACRPEQKNLTPLWGICDEELFKALEPSLTELIEEREAIRHLLGRIP